jgi:predicted helicase
VKLRAEGIDNAAGKQKIVVELYDKFFRNAFPKMTERLGIVYTPVEVVDFIIHSVGHVLQSEFGQTLGSKGVHIIDPFVGTGTFVTRLLQSGLIKPEELPHKYKHEIHANEIVLLAYYIACINIEAVYHGVVGGKYQPFEGICLADTFQLYEKEDLVDAVMAQNSARRKRQKKLDIRVIFGNPPYSIGQESANENNQNVPYPHLDSRVRSTYAAKSSGGNARNLYDSYIRAIRWASDRIGNSGVIGFVTNAGFLETSTADGLRRCLAEEFSSIYVFHLRGNQRTAGELSRKEGGKIFGSGSRAPIAISILVKNPSAMKHGQIYFHDIGDYLTREEKLAKISSFGSIDGIMAADGWRSITPDSHGDWLRQRDDSFGDFVVLGDKKNEHARKLFDNFSLGVTTNRDAWCYGFSKKSVDENMRRMIAFYSRERERYIAACAGRSKDQCQSVDELIDTDSTKIGWSRGLKQMLSRERRIEFDAGCLVKSLYRPFTMQWLYFSRLINEYVYQMPRFFPDADTKNRVILISGSGAKKGFTALMTNVVADLNSLDAGAQCFPLFIYDERDDKANDGATSNADLFATVVPEEGATKRRDALTDDGLALFRTSYPGERITKEDIFYYVYGLLHSPDYRERYADNLSKELPRIPCVKTDADFWAFSKAGRELADLHINYETAEMYPLQIEGGGLLLTDADYRVEKMKPGKNGKDKDLTTLIYNDKITVKGIPPEAYEYVVNGKPALDWVVERQCVKVDDGKNGSGIVNDANDYAIETMNNPRYPLELFQRVVTVSLETMKIVKSLPRLDVQQPGPTVGQLMEAKDEPDALTA